MLPYFVKLVKEIVVIFDMTKLRGRVPIFLQCPVGGRGQHQMYALRLQALHLTRITYIKPMDSWNPLNRLFDDPYRVFVFRETWNRHLWITQMFQFWGDKC